MSYVVEGVYGSGTGYRGIEVEWYGVQGKVVCWYLKFENNSTIQYVFVDHTTFHIASLIKI